MSIASRAPTNPCRGSARQRFGVRRVAVLERGWIGGGNTGRNTTIVRSNYLWDESAHLYEHALKLFEGLSQDLNYNVMFSQRGVLMLAISIGCTAGRPEVIMENK